MQQFAIVPATQVAARDFHAAFTSAFSDYLIGAFQLPFDGWPQFLARQGADLAASRIALGSAGILSFALVAPRGDAPIWRLATMGAVPAARGCGAAPALLDDFIARAAAAGQRTVELECFAQNERALRLYRSRRFREVHALHGYAGTADAPIDDARTDVPQAISIDDAFDWLRAMGRDVGTLPLQVTPAVLRHQAELHAWRTAGAQLIAGTATAGRVAVGSLIDTTPGQTATPLLVACALRAHPGRTLHVPQLQRRDLGGDALERMGLQRLPFHQVLMRRPAHT